MPFVLPTLLGMTPVGVPTAGAAFVGEPSAGVALIGAPFVGVAFGALSTRPGSIGPPVAGAWLTCPLRSWPVLAGLGLTPVMRRPPSAPP
jgi:hypothetical protein